MSYGTGTYGTQTYGGDAGVLSLDAVAPERASRLGGELITVTGSFDTAESYTVTVGGVAAYSGVAGQGNTISPTSDTELSFVLPPLGTGSKTIVVTEVGGSSANISLTILERNFGSASFEMRRLFPRWQGVGPRSLELEPQE